MSTFLLGVLSGVVTAVICHLASKGINVSQNYRQSEFSGRWVDEIYKDDTRQDVIKRDEYELHYHKHDHTISGTIQRVYPYEQRYRNWTCNGVLYDRFIILCFWRDGPQKSSGCIYAKMDNGDGKYSGYYLEEHNTGFIDKTPIALFKQL